MTAHLERHFGDRAGWLRAAVLGADDGIVSTAALMAGVSAAAAGPSAVLTSGLAGLAAGAMSMAAGEFVSVASQRDVEVADERKERSELAADPAGELDELTRIYQERGLDRRLAEEVAGALTAHDAVTSHLRDELGRTESTTARPVQAAVVSALSFALGAAIPILTVLLAPSGSALWALVLATLVALGVLGAAGAHLGGANRVRGALRVLAGGTAALAVTMLVGRLVGLAGV